MTVLPQWTVPPRGEPLTRLAFATLGRDLLARIEFGDTLLYVYFLVLVRPWFWGIDNFTAWCLTLPLALLAWYVYVSTKTLVVDKPGLPFWLVVGLPLFLIYALRAPFPDTSFDVWSLRLFHGERGLRGFLYLPGEFFPTSAPFNPTPDMLTGIFRHLLGYRIGTIVNFLTLLWAGTILDKLLRPYIRRPWLRALGVLLALWTEHVLFEINNYMVDLLALPLMLEATRLVLDTDEWKRRRNVMVRVAFLVGASIALKLPNAGLVCPLFFIYIWRARGHRPRNWRALATDALASALVFAAPLVRFMFWVYRLTGSPICPIYNRYFRSPFYNPSNAFDGRWGGYGAPEILTWPVQMFFQPGRIAELGVYSGRLSVAFVVALACLILARRIEPRTLVVAFTIVLGSLLWSLTIGYIRYGLYLEVLSSVLLIAVSASLLRRFAGRAPPLRAVAILVCLVMIAQSALATRYVLQQEWSMRPTLFQAPVQFSAELKYMLRDRSLRVWLPDRERKMFDQVDVWIVSGIKTAGFISFLNDRAPVIGVGNTEIFLQDASRREFARTLESHMGKRMYSLALPANLDDVLLTLRSVGLEAVKIQNATVPFYGRDDSFYFYFLEIARANPLRAAPTRTQSTGVISEDAARARIRPLDAAQLLKPGEITTIFFTVTNTGNAVWPSLAGRDGSQAIALSCGWLDSLRKGAISQQAKATLPYDLLPGESTPLAVTVTAPSNPGDYLLEVDMAQRDGTLFLRDGSLPVDLKVRVEP